MRWWVLVVSLVFGTEAVLAGTYFGVPQFVRIDVDAGPGFFPAMLPFAIVHPYTYIGLGGDLELGVCVDSAAAHPDNRRLVGPVLAAIAAWNELTPITENCTGCLLEEEADVPPMPLDAFSVVLHELGHCAMGLDHINMFEIGENDPNSTPEFYRSGVCDLDNDGCCGARTSFTASVNATDVFSDPGTPRGDLEDLHENNCPTGAIPGAEPPSIRTSEEGAGCSNGTQCPVPAECCPDPPPGAPILVEDVHWFREIDNNPFAIDAQVIEDGTYSRNATVDLPAGHSYVASGNVGVGESLIYPDAQAVMYTRITSGTQYHGLAADDANMVRMGMTGQDRLVGGGDDYTIRLVYRADCSSADLRVGHGMLSAGIGNCSAAIVESFPQSPLLRRHYSLAPPGGSTHLDVTLGEEETWDYGEIIFSGGFESGDVTGWDAASP